MTTRVLPEADRFATCPNDGKVLDYYAGVFESVYVSLSPFLAPLSDAFVAMCDSTDPEAGPDRIAIVAHCRPVPWREVARESGLPDLAAVDIALRTQIGGLSAAFRNTDYAARLKRLYENDRLWPPIEGQHAELLQHTVLELFQALGHDWVWVGDEFGTQRRLYWIDDIKKGIKDPIRGHCNVFAPDHSLLWTVHWDSHFSFLCAASGDALRSVNVETTLEGFFCGPDTQVYWSSMERAPR